MGFIVALIIIGCILFVGCMLFSYWNVAKKETDPDNKKEAYFLAILLTFFALALIVIGLF